MESKGKIKQNKPCEYWFDNGKAPYATITISAIIYVAIWSLLFAPQLQESIVEYGGDNKMSLLGYVLFSIGYFTGMIGSFIFMAYQYIYENEKLIVPQKYYIDTLKFVLGGTIIYCYKMNSLTINKMWDSMKTHDLIKERQIHLAVLVGLVVLIGSIVNIFVRGQQATPSDPTAKNEINNSFATSYYVIFVALTVGGMGLYYGNKIGNAQLFIYYGLVFLLSLGVIEYYKQQKT